MKSCDVILRAYLVSMLVICASLGQVQAQPVGNDEFSSNNDHQNTGRPFRDIPSKYPECADPVYEYWEKTDELKAKAEERRQAVDPESHQITQEINDLAAERTDVGKDIQDCIREVHDNRRKTNRTPLQARIEKNVELIPEETSPDDTQQGRESENTPSGDASPSKKKPQSKTKTKSSPEQSNKDTSAKPQPHSDEPQLGPPGKGKEAPPPKKKKPEVKTPDEGPRPPIVPEPPQDKELPGPDEKPSPKEPEPLSAPKPNGPNFSLNLIDPPAFSYVKGMGKGFEDCANDVGANIALLWQAAQAMMAGNFPQAEQILGIPEQVLRGTWDDLNKQIILSPEGGKITQEEESKIAYENGRSAAKRLCEAIPLGKAAKCVGGVFAKACGKFGKTVADAGGKIKGKVGDVGKKAKEKAIETGKKVKEKADRIAKNAKEKIDEAKKGVREKAKEVQDKLRKKKEGPDANNGKGRESPDGDSSDSQLEGGRHLAVPHLKQNPYCPS